MEPRLSQLRMGFDHAKELEPPRPAPGYGLRTYRPGDEEAWLDILHQGNFGEWDRARLDRLLSGERAPLPRDGIFFVTKGDRPVGTACAFLFDSPERGEFSELGWVAVLPEHRGHGLGRTVCQAVLGYAREIGHTYTFLLTEDYRPAAIKTYLRLGFEPEMMDETQPERWARLRTLLSV